MRIARLRLEGDDLAALVYEGGLYRVDLLDDVLGSSLPRDLWETAGRFDRRLFSMGAVDLAEHQRELSDGLDAEDCRVTCPPAQWLAPCGLDPALFEWRPATSSLLRLDGRSLFGHNTCTPTPETSKIVVRPCIGLILNEELHLTSAAEIERALWGMCLGLAWTVLSWETCALAEGLGAGAGRSLGTHLGPWLQPVEPGDYLLQIRCGNSHFLATNLTLDRTRCAELLLRVVRFSRLSAGDVLLLVASDELSPSVGEWVEVYHPALGTLRGRAGLSAFCPF